MSVVCLDTGCCGSSVVAKKSRDIVRLSYDPAYTISSDQE
jgi:hypothetical protein